MTTEVVYISGVHGVGKSTVITHLARRLEKGGSSVYVFPEMSYRPDIPIGTLEFQIWFKKQIVIREILIDALLVNNSFDYILLDRHLIDIDIYTSRLTTDVLYDDTSLRVDAKIYILDAKVSEIIKRIQSRNGEEFREEWNEGDTEYISYIAGAFLNLAKTFRYEVIENNSVEETTQKIMEMIY